MQCNTFFFFFNNDQSTNPIHIHLQNLMYKLTMQLVGLQDSQHLLALACLSFTKINTISFKRFSQEATPYVTDPANSKAAILSQD